MAENTEHPILATMYLLAGIFLIGAFLIDTQLGNGTASGFMVIYAFIATFLGALGHVVVLLTKLLSRARRQMGVA